jgi:hypothetical protein
MVHSIAYWRSCPLWRSTTLLVLFIYSFKFTVRIVTWFEVLMTVSIKITVFWDVTPLLSTLKVEAASLYWTLVAINLPTCHQSQKTVILILSRFKGVTVDGDWIGYWICWHHSELQVITAPSPISILYRSLLQTLSYIQPAVSSTAVSW